MKYRLLCEMIPEEGGGYSAVAVNLPGCGSQGETWNEALENFEEAAIAAIESYIADEADIPWVDVPDPRGLQSVVIYLN